jgi:uncharacterized RDD family membrane protein YckC
MANTWYVTLDGAEQGPLDTAGVRSLVAQGRIGPTTPIRRDDMAAPVPAAKVKGLLPPPGSSAQPGTAAVARPATAAVNRPAPRPATASIPRPAARPTPAAGPPPSDNPFAAPVAGVTTAQHEDDNDYDYELAGRWRRLLAAFCDTAIMVASFVVVGVILGLLFASSAGSEVDADEEGAAGGIAAVVGIGVALLAWMAVNGWFLHSRGQTLGKMMLGIRIVRIDGQRTTGIDTILKRLLPTWAAGMVPMVGPVFNLVNVLFIFREDRRCIHDLIAGTHVISTARTRPVTARTARARR